MNIIFFIGLTLDIIAIILILINIIFSTNKKLTKNKNSNYAILIPARDESKVIRNTLKHIKIQNKDMSNVYVIIEDKNDQTYNIAKEFNANVYIRKKPVKHKKGYALDECLKDILKTKHYDLYFIIDADNILDKNFIKNMLKYWHKGYEVTTGFRNTLNSKNLVSSCSGLLFCLHNTILNKFRNINNLSVILCGSGFYIDGKIIEKLNGFPFYSLTEDFEFSLYMSEKNIKSYYAKDCIYYDEQPTSLKVSIKQRTRWLKGQIDAKKLTNNAIKKSINEAIVMISSVILFIGLALLLIGMATSLFTNIFKIILFILLELYLLLVIMTLYLYLCDWKKINIHGIKRLTSIIFNPLFLSTYLICYIKAIFTKNLEWGKIEHKGM